MTLEIRQEKEQDWDRVFELNKAAFGRDGEARLVELLRKRNDFVPGLSLVATLNNDIVGHILFTKIKIKSHQMEAESLALAPVAVLPQWQRKGIGRQLVQAGLQKAKELQFISVIVLGHADYYPKFGFLPADRWNIRSPYNLPANVFMALELVTDGLKDAGGLVHYPPEFEAV